MGNRTAAAFLILGGLGGYLLAGGSAAAQSSSAHPPSVVAIGQEVVLQFERGALSESVNTLRCAVVSVEENWAKCTTPESFDPARGEKWVNLVYVVQITRREK
jgi:hypothetical protein